MGKKLQNDSGLIKLLTWFGSTKAGAWTIINLGTRVDRWLIKFSDGRFNSTFAWPCLLLTTVGAKSGRTRTVALVYITESDNIVLIASKGGSLRNPSWYLNLKANPEAQVFINGKVHNYIASDAEGDERDRLWQKALELYSGYEKYQKRAGERQIPVVVLRPLK